MSTTNALHASNVLDVPEVLRHLPLRARDRIEAELFETALSAVDSGDLAPLREFLDRLITTAQMHGQPAFQKALQEADDSRGATVHAAASFDDLKARYAVG